MTTKGTTMKKTLASVALLVISATPLLAETAERKSYLVGTKGRVAPRVLMQEIDSLGTETRAFRFVEGFAAELTEEEVRELRASRRVRFVEPDPEKKAMASPLISASKSQVTPYGIGAVNASRIWSISTGRTVKVGVIDSGIDKTHPDLAPVYKGGYDFIDKDDDPTDDHGHGTHVAGTIAAVDNQVGVVGVAPNVEIYALRTLKRTASGNATGSTAAVIAAIDWAIANKLNIISLSLGSDSSSTLEREAFNRAEAAGVLAIAASGNGYDENPVDGISYPAAYESVVSVGATDAASKIAAFSQRGPGLDIVAPGVEVMSTFPQGFSKFDFIETIGLSEIDARAMTGSPSREISGDYVYANLGRPQDFNSTMRGRIALIKRGEITFNEKAKNAINAGAVGVVIFNREPGNFGGTLIGQSPAGCTPGVNCTDNPADLAYPWVPTVSISMEDGEALLQLAQKNMTVKMGINADYTFLQGTSMATPHVSGVAALIWSLKPTAKASEVRQALLSTAKDLGAPGVDNVFGNGLVDALAAAQKFSPASFGPPRATRRR